MRTIEFTREDTGEKREINIRGLKRKELRQLKEYGYGAVIFNPDRKSYDEHVEKSLAMVLSGEDIAFLEDCVNTEYLRAWSEMTKETYGNRDEEKNSSATTGGTGTPAESTTVASAPQMENENPSA